MAVYSFQRMYTVSMRGSDTICWYGDGSLQLFVRKSIYL